VTLNAGGSVHQSNLVINHADYDSSSLANDISLVRTGTPFAFGDNVAIVPLDIAGTGAGVNIVLTGWGHTSWQGSASNILQRQITTTLTNADCSNRFEGTGLGYHVIESKLCSWISGEGSCQG